MKTEIRTDLLRKLADHLINGKLGHEKFDFNHFNTWDSTILEKRGILFHHNDSLKDFQKERNYCGTAGCAIGECPIVWPDKWIFQNEEGFFSVTTIEVAERGGLDEEESGMNFFNIDYDQFAHLFYSGQQKLK